MYRLPEFVPRLTNTQTGDKPSGYITAPGQTTLTRLPGDIEGRARDIIIIPVTYFTIIFIHVHVHIGHTSPSSPNISKVRHERLEHATETHFLWVSI